MKKRNNSFEYRRNLQLSLIASLCLAILVFSFYPNPSVTNNEMPVYGESLITVMDIPITNQNSAPQISAPQPPPVVTNLFLEIDDPELLEDVELDDNSLAASENVGKDANDSFGGNGSRVLNSLPFAPRQVLWVVPKKDEDIDGFITFSLLIGTNGMVKQHKILKNTIREPKFVQNVVASLYKCKWAPVIMEGDKVEFWIELTYQ